MRLNAKRPILILFSIAIFALLTLFLIRSYHTNSAYADTGQNLTVFQGTLATQFSNWSWGSQVNLSNPSPAYSGAQSIKFTPSAYGGLYIHSSVPISSTLYSALQFAMQTTQAPQNFTIIFYGSGNQKISSLSLSDFTGSSQNGWLMYSIPAASLPSMITGIAFQDTSGKSGITTYLDSIQFIANQVTPTITSTEPDTSNVTETTDINQSYPIYSGTLTSGWTNWSWASSVNFSQTPLYNGNDVISFTPTANYGGFYIHTGQGVDTTPYQTLTFALKAGSSGQTYAIGAYDANNNLINQAISLNTLGGQPMDTGWEQYSVQLSDLGAVNKVIKGIMIQDTSGHSGQTLYISQIALTSKDTIQLSLVPSQSPSNSPQNNNPLSGMQFFNDPNGDPALMQEEAWQSSNPADADTIAKIATQPKAIWVGDWTANVQAFVENEMNSAKNTSTVPVFVAYNIPERDCGGYSSGGATSASDYQAWISSFANGIGQGRAVVILEPDALAQISCLSSADQQTRYSLLSMAVSAFKSMGQTTVYIDAGHAGWIDPATMADSLIKAGISQADGFSLNVSNFDTDSDSISYGDQISALIQQKHFVIDTSRNGNGPTLDNQWCNPPGMALGDKPTTNTGNTLVDAFMWIKYPGESDGTCNGGPAAGVWFPSYALDLAQQASW